MRRRKGCEAPALAERAAGAARENNAAPDVGTAAGQLCSLVRDLALPPPIQLLALAVALHHPPPTTSPIACGGRLVLQGASVGRQGKLYRQGSSQANAQLGSVQSMKLLLLATFFALRHSCMARFNA